MEGTTDHLKVCVRVSFISVYVSVCAEYDNVREYQVSKAYSIVLAVITVYNLFLPVLYYTFPTAIST